MVRISSRNGGNSRVNPKDETERWKGRFQSDQVDLRDLALLEDKMRSSEVTIGDVILQI